MSGGFGWLRAARVLAVTLLVVILVLAVTTGDDAEELGPFPTGGGDAVSIAPRAVP